MNYYEQNFYFLKETENQSVFATVQPTNFQAQAVLTFLSVVFNISGVVNSTANTLVVPRCGLYWTHVGVRTASTSVLADLSIVSAQVTLKLSVFLKIVQMLVIIQCYHVKIYVGYLLEPKCMRPHQHMVVNIGSGKDLTSLN